MKKIIVILLAFTVFACKKAEVQPEEPKEVTEPQKKSDDTTWKMKSVINYSTSSTPTPSEQDLFVQSADTTFYEILKNGKTALTWKMNWTYTSTPAYNSIDDVKSLLNCKKGDTITWLIIHRTPRNVDGYAFSGGVTLIKNDGKNYPADYKHWFNGQFQSGIADKYNVYYKPNVKTFVQIWQGVVE